MGNFDYPDDSIQQLVESWWEKDESKSLVRGALIWAHVQFFHLIPMELVPERIEAERHDQAFIRVQPLYSGRRQNRTPALPVAGLPHLQGADCHITNRAKKRPCLVLGATDQASLDKKLVRSTGIMGKHQYFLVAPYFSITQEGRAGCPPEFTERIMHAEYNRFFWDSLPGPSGRESILRFDQIQPVGFHHDAYEHSGFKLSDQASSLIDEWLNWLLHDRKSENIAIFRELIQEAEGSLVPCDC